MTRITMKKTRNTKARAQFLAEIAGDAKVAARPEAEHIFMQRTRRRAS